MCSADKKDEFTFLESFHVFLSDNTESKQI